MGQKYSSNSSSGYNATPPADDGTVSEANKGKWSTIKEKLSDPVKTLADAINTDLVEHFDNGPVAYTSNQTIGASHYGKIIQVSGAANTQTLSDAATLGAGWNCEFVSTDTSNTITIARATASDMVNETTANIALLPLQSVKAVVNAAANGFLVKSERRTDKINRISEELLMSSKSLWMAEGANVASASDCNIWTTDGNTVHVTGTTTITDWGTAPQAGAWKWVIFDDALQLTYNATTNKLNSNGSNYTTVNGDRAFVYAESTSSYLVTIFPLNGSVIAAISANVQSFTSSGAGTWTKPSGYLSSSIVKLQAWGGGGGGGGTGGAGEPGGGGGGAYVERWLVLSDMGATESISVGAGGGGGNPSGAPGGNTTIGSLLTAYGGSGGIVGTGGSGGSEIAVSAGGAGGTAGVAGSNGSQWSGGGGGGSGNANGGKSFYGGGGGGGGQAGVCTTGGTSVYGGAGGNGGTCQAPGTAPGGGGGGGILSSTIGSAGAVGKVVITVYH